MEERDDRYRKMRNMDKSTKEGMKEGCTKEKEMTQQNDSRDG